MAVQFRFQFHSTCRYKPKIPLDKLSEETRARHEELAQALRQVYFPEFFSE
jgi:hypothetical protein